MQSSLLTADGTNASVCLGCRAQQAYGIRQQREKEPFKTKGDKEFSHCSMGKGRRRMQAYKYPSPPPARVYSEEEASPDTIIAMRGKRPPVPGYLLSNQIWYVIFI